MGIVARPLMRSGNAGRMQRALRLYAKATQWIEKHHEQLGTDQEIATEQVLMSLTQA